jgi:hypothetical protein
LVSALGIDVHAWEGTMTFAKNGIVFSILFWYLAVEKRPSSIGICGLFFAPFWAVVALVDAILSATLYPVVEFVRKNALMMYAIAAFSVCIGASFGIIGYAFVYLPYQQYVMEGLPFSQAFGLWIVIGCSCAAVVVLMGFLVAVTWVAQNFGEQIFNFVAKIHGKVCRPVFRAV